MFENLQTIDEDKKLKLLDEDKKFIDFAMGWLEKNEPNWKLQTPINREEFLKVLREKIGKPIHGCVS